MRPDKFNDTVSVDTFLAQFDICCSYNSWNDRDKAAHLKCCLTGIAGQLLWDTGHPDELTYDELREKLRRRFGSDDQQEKFQAELRARRRRRGETLAELYQDIRRLMSLAYPGERTSSLCEQIAKDYFIASLGDRDFELQIREREPRDLESAFKHAVRLEAYDKAVVDDNRDHYKSKGNRYKQDDGLSRKVAQLERKVGQATTQQPVLRPAVTSDAQTTAHDTMVRELKDAMAKLSRQYDELRKEMGQLRLLEEQRKGANTQSTAVPVAVPAPGNASHIEQPPTGRTPPKCYYCGDIGHFIKDCEKKNQYGRNNGVSQTDDQYDADAVRGQTYLRLVVNGKSSKCLLDTGSDVTLLPTSVVAGLNSGINDSAYSCRNWYGYQGYWNSDGRGSCRTASHDDHWPGFTTC